MRRLLTAIAGLSLASVLLASCGSDSSSAKGDAGGSADGAPASDGTTAPDGMSATDGGPSDTGTPGDGAGSDMGAPPGRPAACLDRPADPLAPPSAGLPCDLIPPGFPH
jgi:hypothetical protein